MNPQEMEVLKLISSDISNFHKQIFKKVFWISTGKLTMYTKLEKCNITGLP